MPHIGGKVDCNTPTSRSLWAPHLKYDCRCWYERAGSRRGCSKYHELVPAVRQLAIVIPYADLHRPGRRNRRCPGDSLRGGSRVSVSSHLVTHAALRIVLRTAIPPQTQSYSYAVRRAAAVPQILLRLLCIEKGCDIESALFKFDHCKASFRLCHVIPLWSLMKRPGISPPEQSA